MIAIDSSVLIDWLAGDATPEAERLQELLALGAAALPPPAISEIFSSPKFGPRLSVELNGFRLLSIVPGYWRRAGLLRANVRSRLRKAALGDTLIAQACIDADVPLLTRDKDFRWFAEFGGLKLA